MEKYDQAFLNSKIEKQSPQNGTGNAPNWPTQTEKIRSWHVLCTNSALPSLQALRRIKWTI